MRCDCEKKTRENVMLLEKEKDLHLSNNIIYETLAIFNHLFRNVNSL